jgi:biopolymer transport protein ExbD
LVVTIAGDPAAPRLALNGNPLASVEALADRLAEVVALGAQPPVIVDPLPEMPMDVVIEVYDLARGVGLDRVLFAADP